MARLMQALAGAGVSWDQVAGYRSLAGGTFNDVHLVDLADPSEQFNAGRFVNEAEKLITEIHTRGFP